MLQYSRNTSCDHVPHYHWTWRYIVIVCILQMRHLCDTGESREMRIEIENVINSSTPKLARNGLYLFKCFTRDRKLFSKYIHQCAD